MPRMFLLSFYINFGTIHIQPNSWYNYTYLAKECQIPIQYSPNQSINKSWHKV